MNFKTKTIYTENLAIVKIYFRYGQSVTRQKFWKKLWNNNLEDFLLKKAKTKRYISSQYFYCKKRIFKQWSYPA